MGAKEVLSGYVSVNGTNRKSWSQSDIGQAETLKNLPNQPFT